MTKWIAGNARSGDLSDEACCHLPITNHQSHLTVPGAPGAVDVLGVPILAQAMLDQMVCRPTLSPHPLFQRAVGYNFCLGWCA
jgi:hypothetical protein